MKIYIIALLLIQITQSLYGASNTNAAPISIYQKMGEAAPHIVDFLAPASYLGEKFIIEKSAQHLLNSSQPSYLKRLLPKPFYSYLGPFYLEQFINDITATPLINIAAQTNSLFWLAYFKEREYTNYDESEALHAAIAAGAIEAIDFLIENGADINKKDYWGKTPIDIAMANKNSTVVFHLMSKGAINWETFFQWIPSNFKPNQTSNINAAPISIYQKMGKAAPHVVNFFAPASYLGEKFIIGDITINIATQTNSLFWLAYFKERKYTNYDESEALHTAAAAGSIEAIDFLIENGADINKKDYWDKTPIDIAIIHKQHAATLHLIKKKDKINFDDKNSPIFTAIENTNILAVMFLILGGANLNCTRNGWFEETPLMCAITMRKYEIAEFLITFKAKQDYKGIPLLFELITRDDVEGIKLLIENGADINSHNKQGDTPLHLAVMNRKINTTKLLIENGADINSHNEQDNTPFHLAVMNASKIDIMELLIKKGADIDSHNKQGDTPLHLAAMNRKINTMKLLIENGADINITNKKAMTAIECLFADAFKNYKKLIQFLETTKQLNVTLSSNISNKCTNYLINLREVQSIEQDEYDTLMEKYFPAVKEPSCR